jgi:hypothetical protein
LFNAGLNAPLSFIFFVMEDEGLLKNLIPEQHILFVYPVQDTDTHVKVNLYIFILSLLRLVQLSFT